MINHKIKRMEWPKGSSDLNPIENLWHYFKRQVSEFKPRPENIEEFKNALITVWDGMETRLCRKLINSMSRRMENIIKLKGNITKY